MNSVILKQSLDPQQQFSSATSTKPKAWNLDIVRSLRMHWTAALAVAAAAFILIFAFGLMRSPYYQTQALIYVQPVKAKLITDSSGGTFDSSRYDTYIQQQLQTITRSDILAEALSKPSAQGWRLYPGEPDQSAIVRLQHALKVERDQGSYQLTISLSGSDSQVIAGVVNAVSDAYIRGERTDELAQSDQQLQILKGERQRIQNDWLSDRREQAALSANLGVADTAVTGEASNPYDVQLAELRSQLATATAAHDVASVQLSSVTNGAPGSTANLNAAAEEISATDPGVATLKQTISQRRSALASQMAGLTPQNPLFKQDQDELKRLDQSLETMSNEVRARAAVQLQQKLKLEASRTAGIQNRFAEQLAAKTALATSATPRLQRAADLAIDVTRLQGRFTEVDNAISAIELEKSTTGLVHVLLPAVAPQRPMTSKRLLILGSALPLALLFGVFAAVALQKLDPRIYIASDLVGVLDFQPMAVLPDRTDVDTSVTDEFMLRLVAGVDQAHRIDGARTFVFTAASPKSGITDLVASVAKKMERLGYRTVILKSSAVLESLTVPGEDKPYRSTRAELSQPDQNKLANVPHESLVVGKLDRIKQNVDLLFIEALPFLSSAESEFATRLSDVTILIAESGRTTRSELKNSLELVRRLGIAGVATVLAEVSLRHADVDFLSVVQNVQLRHSEIMSKDTHTSRNEHATRPLAHDEEQVRTSRDRQPV